MTKSNWKSGVETLFVISVFVVLLVLVAVEDKTSLEFLSLEFWSTNSKGEALRNIAFAIGTPAALLLAYLRTKSAGAQAETAIRQAETAIRQADIVESGQNIDRFQNAIEMLEDENFSKRIGGLIILKRVADNDPDGYYISVQETLCFFIRERTKTDQDTETDLGATPEATSPDVVRALKIVSDLRTNKNMTLEKEFSYRPDLTGAILRGVRFSKLNLDHIDLVGVELRNCSFSDSTFRQSFISAYVSKTVFSNCEFDKAMFEHTVDAYCVLNYGVSFVECKLNIIGSDLSIFKNTVLTDCNIPDDVRKQIDRIQQKAKGEDPRQIAGRIV